MKILVALYSSQLWTLVKNCGPSHELKQNGVTYCFAFLFLFNYKIYQIMLDLTQNERILASVVWFKKAVRIYTQGHGNDTHLK